MKNEFVDGLLAEGFAVSGVAPLPGDVLELVNAAIEKTMKPNVLKLAASGDAEGLESLGRSIAVEEGKLLEAVVIALACRNQDMTVLTGMKLPVADAALAIIEHNDSRKVQTLSIDPESKAKRSYYPDLVLANRKSAEAIVIDVKRSVASYVMGNRLGELTTRMQAAGLVLPDILWRDHDRLAVSHVTVAIVDGSRTDAGSANGIWSLSQLDDLLGVPGLGKIAQSAIASFRSGIGRYWKDAVMAVSSVYAYQAAPQFFDDNIIALRSASSPEKVSKPHCRSRELKPSRVHTVKVGLVRPQAMN